MSVDTCGLFWTEHMYCILTDVGHQLGAEQFSFCEFYIRLASTNAFEFQMILHSQELQAATIFQENTMSPQRPNARGALRTSLTSDHRISMVFEKNGLVFSTTSRRSVNL